MQQAMAALGITGDGDSKANGLAPKYRTPGPTKVGPKGGTVLPLRLSITPTIPSMTRSESSHIDNKLRPIVERIIQKHSTWDVLVDTMVDVQQARNACQFFKIDLWCRAERLPISKLTFVGRGACQFQNRFFCRAERLPISKSTFL